MQRRRDDDGRAPQALVLLDEASRLLAGWTCPASTECCRFSLTGREPSLTEAEWDLVETEVRRQGRKLPQTPDDGTCPFLTSAGRCSVYAVRPLGCRTYFCERASGPGPQPKRELRALVGALEAVSRGKGRTLRSWLAEARRR